MSGDEHDASRLFVVQIVYARSARPERVQVSCGSAVLDLQLDIGAVSVLDMDTVCKLRPPPTLVPARRQLHNFDGSEIAVAGTVQ